MRRRGSSGALRCASCAYPFEPLDAKGKRLLCLLCRLETTTVGRQEVTPGNDAGNPLWFCPEDNGQPADIFFDHHIGCFA